MHTAGWQGVDLAGLSIDDAAANSLLCNSLQRCGLATDGDVESPLYPRLDWSRADGTTAAGLAFFSVVVRELLGRGQRYQIIEPADRRLLSLVTGQCSDLEISGEWTPAVCESFSGARIECLAATKIAQGTVGMSHFLDVCADALSPHSVAGEVALCMGCVQELIGNALGHAESPHAAAVLFRMPTRRPVVIEIGIADCGPGIAATILRQERHHGLTSFSDATLLDAVFRSAFSGRDAEQGGGGFGRTFTQVAECPATQLVIRSGCGWLSTARDAQGFRKSRFTWGVGTQASLTLRLSR